MPLWPSLKTLPLPLVILFAIFSVMPFASLAFVPDPMTSFAHEGLLRAVTLTLGYWVVPLLIAYYSLRRAFAIIPLFFLECGLLLLHSLQDITTQPHQIQLIRYSLIGGMSLFTFVFLNKDVLYPLLSGNGRAWRAAPRLYVQVPMLLWYHNEPNAKLPIVVHNCSLTGIGISGPKDRMAALLTHKDQLNHFVIQVGYGAKNWMLNVQLVRTREEAAIMYAGLRVFNTEAMINFVGEVETLLPPQHTLPGLLSHYWVRSGFRHAVLALWVASMVGAFMIPGCASHVLKSSGVTKPMTKPAPTSKMSATPQKRMSIAESPAF